MLPHPDDTIVAQSSATGAGLRGVVRLSGPRIQELLTPLFSGADRLDLSRRQFCTGRIRIANCLALPAELYFMPGPNTYTGQHLAEIHTVASPPLVDRLIATLLDMGARAAQPGEFTLRAFLAGKCDLPKAEAVLGVIEAGDRSELTQALVQLAGGVTQPLTGLREDLLNLLADVEAGLDFSEEDITFVGRDDLLIRLARGLAQVTNLRRQLESRSVASRPFRVALVGPPNAGKSSLFNALTAGASLVSPMPGTTRDYLMRPIDLNGIPGELIDTAGWQDSFEEIESQAQRLGAASADAADLVLVCVEAGTSVGERAAILLATGALRVATKCDRNVPEHGWSPTSVVTGVGLSALRTLLCQQALASRHAPLAPSLSRCRHHVEACLSHLREAHRVVLFDEPAEILAVEVRGALEQLGAMVGVVYTDDLLDRIFSRFCIGK